MVGGVASIPWITGSTTREKKMTREELVAAVDEEISRLEKVRALLASTEAPDLTSSFGNRPAKSAFSAPMPGPALPPLRGGAGLSRRQLRKKRNRPVSGRTPPAVGFFAITGHLSVLRTNIAVALAPSALPPQACLRGGVPAQGRDQKRRSSLPPEPRADVLECQSSTRRGFEPGSARFGLPRRRSGTLAFWRGLSEGLALAAARNAGLDCNDTCAPTHLRIAVAAGWRTARFPRTTVQQPGGLDRRWLLPGDFLVVPAGMALGSQVSPAGAGGELSRRTGDSARGHGQRARSDYVKDEQSRFLMANQGTAEVMGASSGEELRARRISTTIRPKCRGFLSG